MTSLHATLAARFADQYPRSLPAGNVTPEMLGLAGEAAAAAWLADDAQAETAAQAHHDAELGGEAHLIRRFGWATLQPAVQDAQRRKMRAALRALTHHEAGA